MSSLPLDEASQVTSITELHHYQELAVLVEVIHVTHNIVIVTIPHSRDFKGYKTRLGYRFIKFANGMPIIIPFIAWL